MAVDKLSNHVRWTRTGDGNPRSLVASSSALRRLLLVLFANSPALSHALWAKYKAGSNMLISPALCSRLCPQLPMFA